MTGRRAYRVFLAASIALLTLSAVGVDVARGGQGAVYTLTNGAAGNEVALFDRAADGTLTAVGTVSTGGLGTGAGLGSQGALTLSANGQWLLAVNPGSDDLSVFAVSPGGLTLTDLVASGGTRPISVAISKSLVYVLNAGGSGNITGFTISHEGTLLPIPSSTRPLSNNGVGAAPSPTQVSFSPDGDVLVVTERTTNLIDAYAVDDDGVAGNPTTHASAGMTPCGFAFAKHGTLIVSEAAAGAVSSYAVADGDIVVISASVSTGQTATFWVAATKSGKYAYTANAGSGSISAYRVARDGSVTLLDGVAGSTGAGSHPGDLALSHDGRFLYTRVSAPGLIAAFEVHADGSLVASGDASGLPASTAGLAAW